MKSDWAYVNVGITMVNGDSHFVSYQKGTVSMNVSKEFLSFEV